MSATIYKIGTHDGTFHCDEVLAICMLKNLPQYKNAEIIRSRAPNKLQECDIVVDVGGIYDPASNRFDHHQRSFKSTMQTVSDAGKYPWTTKLSSAGLVYYHFGHDIIKHLIGNQSEDDKTDIIFRKVYEDFVEEADSIDNGIHTYDGAPRCKTNTNLSYRVKLLNPAWNDPNPNYENQFRKAMEMVGSEFLQRVEHFDKNWWPARTLVAQALEERFEVNSSGEILELKKGGCPWQEHLYNLEEEQSISGSIKFVIYQDQSGAWRVQGVPIFSGSFESRLALKSDWRGIRDAELDSLSGIPGCIFVHASGFIGGNKTKEGVIEMARQTIQESNNSHDAVAL